MRQPPLALTGHTAQILEIARTAVRSTVMAASDAAALDVAGGALSRISAIAREAGQSTTRGQVVNPSFRPSASAASAFQQVHFMLTLIEHAMQSDALEQFGAADLLREAIEICRSQGVHLQPQTTGEVNHDFA